MGDLENETGWSITDGAYSVRVVRVATRNGERLRIERVGGGAAVDLDAIELESLTVPGIDLSRLLSDES